MSAAHTLWRFKDEGQPDYLDGIKSQYTVAAIDGRVIAYAFQEEPARLIAAAPALLEALEVLMRARDEGDVASWSSVWDSAEVAISLAKGEAK